MAPPLGPAEYSRLQIHEKGSPEKMPPPPVMSRLVMDLMHFLACLSTLVVCFADVTAPLEQPAALNAVQRQFRNDDLLHEKSATERRRSAACRPD